LEKKLGFRNLLKKLEKVGSYQKIAVTFGTFIILAAQHQFDRRFFCFTRGGVSTPYSLFSI
jgi:hypothetical protein